MEFEAYHNLMCEFEVAVNRESENLLLLDRDHPLHEKLRALVKTLKEIPVEQLRGYLRKRYELFMLQEIDSIKRVNKVLPNDIQFEDIIESVAHGRRDMRRPVKTGFVHLSHDLNDKLGDSYYCKIVDRSRRGMGCLYYGSKPPVKDDILYWLEEEALISKAKVCWVGEPENLLYRIGFALL